MNVNKARTGGTLAVLALTIALATGCGGGSQNQALPYPALSQQDATFVTFAAQSSNSEIAAATVATQRSSNSSVLSFARQMIADHNTANVNLAALTSVKQASANALPTTPLPAEAQVLSTYAALSGSAFDRAYMTDQVNAHQATIAMFTTETTAGSATDVKAFATAQLPILTMHLTMAQTLLRALP